MKKAILLLTLSGLVLGLAVLKTTERGVGERAINIASLELSAKRASDKAINLQTPEAVTVAAIPAPPVAEASAVVAVAEPARNAVPAAVDKTPHVRAVPVNEEEAVRIALAKIPGEVREVEYKEGHYKVKIYSGEGRKAKVYINAASGGVDRIKMKS